MERKDIEWRLDRLEHANRILTVGLALLVVLGVAGWTVSGRTAPDIVKARELQLLSDDGKVMLLAKATKNGADVTINDAKGNARSFWRTGPSIALFALTAGEKDPTATVTITAYDGGDTESRISLFSKNEAQMRLEAKGAKPTIRAWGAGKQVILLPRAKPTKG